jgi:hypothetical protein
MSIGETDANIRIDNNLYIGGAGGWITDLLAAKQNASTAITTSNIASQTVASAGNVQGFSAIALIEESIGVHSGSDFVDGTLVITDINANEWAGNSFVMEVSGKSYDSGNSPFKLVMQGYLYADTIINVSAMSYGSYFPAPVIAMRYDGKLSFWWPRASYWNSFLVHVRNADGESYNRVISISNSPNPDAGDKKVSCTPIQVIHTNNIGSQSVSYATSAGSATTATTAGSLTSMNISQFTNNSGYITSVGNITRLWAESHPTDYYVRANWTGTYWQLTSNHPSPVQVGYADSAGSAGAVAWGNVSSKPSNIMFYEGFTLDANTMSSNSTGFTYSVNAPFTGPIARFSTGGGYDLWLGGSYNGGGNAFFLRTRDGDAGAFNAWREIITSGNIGSQSVSYATTAGSLTSMNISQFTNNSGYITSVPNLQYGGGDSLTGAGTATTWDPRGTTYDRYVIGNHTGISLHGYPGYGGVRLYAAGYPTLTTSILRLEASDAVYTFGGLYSDGNAVIHAGNIGSQSVASATDASTLGGFGRGNTTNKIAYFDGTRNLYVNNPESYTGEVRLGAAWNRGGVYASNTLSLSTSGTQTHFVFSDTVPIIAYSTGQIDLAGSTNTPINITGGAHKYLTINPGNGYEAMVRYIGGTGSSWYVGKRTSAQLIGSESFHFYSEAAGATVGGINPSGDMIVTGSMRAPIFYDSQDTTYYLDPNSSVSGIFAGSVGINNTSPVNANWGNASNTKQLSINATDYAVINLLGGSRRFSMGVGDNIFYMCYDNNAGRHNINVNSSGSVTIPVDVRSPVFYDSQDTAYYGDFASSGTSISINGGIVTTAPGGSVLLKHAVSEVDAWIFQENAANWGLYWKNNPSGNHTFGGYTSVGAELFGMSAANVSGNGVLTTNFVGATSAYAQWMLSNYTGYIWSASTIFAAGDMRSPQFRLTNSSNNAYITGNSDWGMRMVNDNGYIQFGPANGTWAHIYSGLPFYFNQELYVNGTQLVKNSGTWGINISGEAAGLNSSNYIARTGTSGDYNQDFRNTPAGTVRHQGDDATVANNPGAAWWFLDNYRHSNGSNFWGTQVAWGWEDNANRLATRNVTGGSFGAWVYYLNSSNFTTYAQEKENQRLSTTSSPTFVDIYANEWFRNNNINEGVYNQATGTHFYSHSGQGWVVTGSGGTIELQFRSNHQSTLRGYVYADTNNNIGFLNNAGGWTLRTNSSSNVFVHGTDLTINADNAASSNIYMNDGDEGMRQIHCNSNRIGFLTQAGGWGSYCSDDGSWTSVGDITAFSDERLKTNIKTIENALEKTLKMRGVSYNRTDSDDKSDKVGVIAQEVFNVLPEVVKEGADGMLSVSYGNIVGVLIEAIKEQQAQIDELKAKLDGLTK